MSYLGDIAEDSTIDFKFPTNDADGASVTYTGGTVRIRKGNDTTGTVSGVTVTKDHDSKTGQHHVQIDTSADAYYAIGADYTVSLDGATIDTQAVNAPIKEFSIENRFDEVDVTKWVGTAVATPDTAGYPKITIKSGTGSGEINLSSGVVDANVTLLAGSVVETNGGGLIYAQNEYGSLIATPGDSMNLASSAITSAKFDQSTAFPVPAAITVANGAVDAKLTYIMDVILTEGGAGRLATAFIKLLDVATPLLVASDVMRGTDGASTHDAAAVVAAMGGALNVTAGIVESNVKQTNGSTVQQTGGRLHVLADDGANLKRRKDK